jgi:hypothetical protein
MVIAVSLYSAFLHSAQAVLKPNAPDPTIKMEEGISEESFDAIAEFAREHSVHEENNRKNGRGATC